MAHASHLSVISKENCNCARVTKLLIDGGTQVLRDVFNKIHPPADLKKHLLDPGNHTILKNLLTRRILVKQQWNKLYPTGGTAVDSKNFDLTLLCLLLRSISNLPKPAAGWDKFPLPTSIDQEDDIVRLRMYRNELYGHIKEPAFTEADFNKHWTNISCVLVRLGGPQYQLEVDQLKVVSMDPADNNYYFQCLEEWFKSEETMVEAVKETEAKLMNKMDELAKTTHHKLDEIKCAFQASTSDSIHNSGVEATEEKLMNKVDELANATHHKLDEIKCAFQASARDSIHISGVEATEKKLMNKMDELAEATYHKLDEIECTFQTLSRVSIPETSVESTKKLMNKMDELVQVTLHKLDEIKCAFHASSRASIPDTSDQDAEVFSRTFKESIQHKIQTDEEFVFSSLFQNKRLEDIFTQMVIHHIPKEKSSPTKEPGVTESPIKIHSIQEIFLDKCKKDNPKSILITGNPGVGKTLFSRKLLSDWSKDCIFNENEEGTDIPKLKFAFLITFRQLNMLEEKMSLIQFLNEFSLLDKRMDRSVMEYIIQHPEQALIIIDGYDEYKAEQRQQMKDEYFTSSFPNNPQSKIPVGALVRKLIKKQVLANSVIIVTSRPGEASEMKNLDFDRNVNILGFSREQFQEYVQKYFQSDKEKQSEALQTIQEKQYVLGSGCVPLMAFLICVYLDFNISNSGKCFPETLTNFYSEIVDCIEKNYNKAMKKDNLDEKTLDSKTDMIKNKISELAAMTLLNGKLTFDDKDLNELNLSKENLTYLKGSSLLFCECSVKKSALSSEVVKLYSFSHTTFHEFFAARHFVTKMRKIPKKIHLTDMTLQFMAGSMVVGKDEQLMKQLLEYIDDKLKEEPGQRASLSLTCLREFGDENLSKIVIQENKNHRYWNRLGGISLFNIDSNVVVMFMTILNTLNSNQLLSSPVPHLLYIHSSHFTVFTTQQLLELLTNTSCTVTRLGLQGCNIDDECCLCLSQYLRRTKLTHLYLYNNPLTERGVDMLLDGCCQGLEELWLGGNNITNKQHVEGLFRDKYPGLWLDI